jgi:hypothetical protein
MMASAASSVPVARRALLGLTDGKIASDIDLSRYVSDRHSIRLSHGCLEVGFIPCVAYGD